MAQKNLTQMSHKDGFPKDNFYIQINYKKDNIHLCDQLIFICSISTMSVWAPLSGS